MNKKIKLLIVILNIASIMAIYEDSHYESIIEDDINNLPLVEKTDTAFYDNKSLNELCSDYNNFTCWKGPNGAIESIQIKELKYNEIINNIH